MSDILTKKEAVEFLGLSVKVFDNYFKNAREFPCIERKGSRGRFMFDIQSLKKWKDGVTWRTVDLTKEDYALCLDFALAMHFKAYVLSDWGTARQREFGQKITNWVKGQLGEIAVKKFLKNKFNVDIDLDFDIYENIVAQDIIGVQKGGVMKKPRIGIGIKSSKPKSAYLVLGENEITIKERRSNVYIYCRPDIPDDHLLRLTREIVIKTIKNQPLYSTYKDLIPDFVNIPCEVVGWCDYTELEKVSSIPGQEFDGFRYVRKSGLLHRSEKEWEILIKRL